MAILPGRRLGPYEILSAIGAGGMGEVYRARDTRLDRTVAIKVLPLHLPDRSDLRERFEREARTIASLNHPHICVLHDIGQQDGTDYLVMEYLEGETLAQRLLKGALPLEQVLQYAIEIADALDKAHRKGVTHRDLKPGNIMLTKSGTKLLDFGLAKLKREAAPANVPPSDLPTANDPLTAHGTIVGTLQYMAPEQLDGKEVDARTDIFAFGAVVYEMATSKRAFEGKSQASVISAIMSSDPAPMTSLQPMTPPAFDHLVKACLAKDPDERWQAASDLTRDLKWIAGGGSQAGMQPTAAPLKYRERFAWITAGMFLLLAVVLAGIHFRESPKDLRPISFSIFPPEKGIFHRASYVAVSPDGSQLAFVSIVDGKQLLWIRPLNSLSARPLPGTEDAVSPFWSPNSKYIAFSSGGRLLKIATSGGPAETICDTPPGFGLSRKGTWNHQGSIIFGGIGGSLYRVAAAGGQPVPLTTLDKSRQEIGHSFPQFLPDGEHFLYLARSGRPENTGIYVGSLDSKDTKRLSNAQSTAMYAAPGYLLFVQDGTLMAESFDVSRMDLSGEPFPIAEQVQEDTFAGFGAAYSVSENGVLVYRSGNDNAQLMFVDREGKQLESIGPLGEYRNPALSPDGKKVVVDRSNAQAGGRDLWLYELSRGSASKLTYGPMLNTDAVWSPDGQQIIFYSNRGGSYGLYRKFSSGAGVEEASLKADNVRQPKDWSPDGKFVLFQGFDPKTGWDLWVLPLLGDRKPIPFVQTIFDENEPQFSPDGHWIAYDANESGRREVYVQSFPASAGKWQISTDGGTQPKWRSDGKELFYLATDGKLMAVPVKADGAFVAGIPKPLFQTMFVGVVTGGFEHYRVTADGQRFLVNMPSAGGTPPPIIVVLNWTAGLKK